LNFLVRFSKNTQISNFKKIRRVGAEFHADGRTDMTKLIVAFHGFADAPQLDLWFTEIGYMFRPTWPSLGEAVAETYKGKRSRLSYTALLC